MNKPVTIEQSCYSTPRFLSDSRNRKIDSQPTLPHPEHSTPVLPARRLASLLAVLLPALLDGLLAACLTGLLAALMDIPQVCPLAGIMAASLAALLAPSLADLMADQRAAWLIVLLATLQSDMLAPWLAAWLDTALLDGWLASPLVGVVAAWLSTLMAAYRSCSLLLTTGAGAAAGGATLIVQIAADQKIHASRPPIALRCLLCWLLHLKL